jgi:2-C-methyl-D-erythritol 4-phosphate cytidylyltransferase/2-C-methyl-D-erythritol 2,4-cyclodiphosphate synthase
MPEKIVTALIMAAGSGTRFGGDTPKQFQSIAGLAPVRRALNSFRRHPQISSVGIVVAQQDIALLKDVLETDTPDFIIEGGAERQISVLNGLEAITALKPLPTHVLIHDAARPIIPANIIDELLIALKDHDAAVPVMPLWDTLSRVIDGNLAGDIPRDGVVARQTPQAFKFAPILAAHREFKNNPKTDDIGLAKLAGLRVQLIQGSPLLHKLTTEDDKALLERLFHGSAIPLSGTGYDVHRFGPGDKVTLCGIPIPYHQGLEGHSDADVAMHALTDAILGAIGEGDIGQHFPPSDQKWKGAASSIFLKHAVELVKRQNGHITNVDVTIVCEKPKIGPYSGAMREALMPILGLPKNRINIKATTSEKLGFTGRSEGIAAMASATIIVWQ